MLTTCKLVYNLCQIICHIIQCNTVILTYEATYSDPALLKDVDIALTHCIYVPALGLEAIQVNYSTMNIQTFCSVRQFRYLAGIVTEQNRSIVIQNTVYIEHRHTVQSMDSQRSQRNSPRGQDSPANKQTVQNGIDIEPVTAKSRYRSLKFALLN